MTSGDFRGLIGIPIRRPGSLMMRARHSSHPRVGSSPVGESLAEGGVFLLTWQSLRSRKSKSVEDLHDHLAGDSGGSAVPICRGLARAGLRRTIRCEGNDSEPLARRSSSINSDRPSSSRKRSGEPESGLSMLDMNICCGSCEDRPTRRLR